MKRILLIMIAGFSIGAFAQNPSVPVVIENQTTCTTFVKLYATDLACIITTYSTVVIPPGGIWTSPTPPAGTWFEAAFVSDNVSF